MPIISAFFGIVIRMYYRDHEPPHFHAEHAGQQAKLACKASSSPAPWHLDGPALESGHGLSGTRRSFSRTGAK